jgi:putative intracellular protease/amidase
MVSSPECQHPSSWTDPAFSLDLFDLVFLPGGHEKSVRQIIDSKEVHRHLVDYFPKTRRQHDDGSTTPAKIVGAVCHGVMVLSEAKDAQGQSPIRDCVTTALPARFEQLAFWGTRAFLGDYYKTYGVNSDDVEVAVNSPLIPAVLPRFSDRRG